MATGQLADCQLAD